MSNIDTLIDSIKDLHIFKNMDNSDIFEILKISEIKKFPSQVTLFHEYDDYERTMYVIISGRVEIKSKSIKTKEMIPIFSAGKGLTFGEMSFLDNQPRSASIITIEPTEAFMISKKFFDQLLEQKPKVAAKFLLGLSNILSRRLRATDQKLKYSL